MKYFAASAAIISVLSISSIDPAVSAGPMGCENPSPDVHFQPGVYEIQVIGTSEARHLITELQQAVSQVQSDIPNVFEGVKIVVGVSDRASNEPLIAPMVSSVLSHAVTEKVLKRSYVIVSNAPEKDLQIAKLSQANANVVVVPSPNISESVQFMKEYKLDKEAYMAGMALHAALGSLLYFNGQREKNSAAISRIHSLERPK